GGVLPLRRLRRGADRGHAGPQSRAAAGPQGRLGRREDGGAEVPRSRAPRQAAVSNRLVRCRWLTAGGPGVGRPLTVTREAAMRIAVTGATGFLGRYILRHLAQSGHELRCWQRADSDLGGFEDVAGSVEWLPGELG